jgi:hypothetical protein
MTPIGIFDATTGDSLGYVTVFGNGVTNTTQGSLFQYVTAAAANHESIELQYPEQVRRVLLSVWLASPLFTGRFLDQSAHGVYQPSCYRRSQLPNRECYREKVRSLTRCQDDCIVTLTRHAQRSLCGNISPLK